jgi:hypothetical protein
MFANRITPLTGCSIWLPETAPPACSPWQAPSQFQSCNTSVQGQAYGDPEVDEEDRLVDDRTVRRNLDLAIGDRVEYAYDFGDNWLHVLELEDKMAPSGEAVYPLCVGGERTAPPEDVGGVSGYEEFLEALFDPPRGARAHEVVGRPPLRSRRVFSRRGQRETAQKTEGCRASCRLRGQTSGRSRA